MFKHLCDATSDAVGDARHEAFCPEDFAGAFPEAFVPTDLNDSEFFSFFRETALPFFN